MSKLTTKQRKRLSKKSFALPKKDGYPIHNKAHASNALARVSAYGTPKEKATVRKKVCAKYPDLPSCKKRKK